MGDIYTPQVMTGVVNSLQDPKEALAASLFPTIQTETSEEIHFDVEQRSMSLAPFVSPVVEGQIMTSLGYDTRTFKPAYIKPKHAIDPNMPLKRQAGEPVGGNLDPGTREQRILRDTLQMHRDMIMRRKEWMASTILRTGAVTISGDLYQTVSVNYGRDAALTVALAAGSKWSDAGISPLNNLMDWGTTVLQKSGSFPVDVIMDVGAWKVFRQNAEVKDRINVQRRLGDTPTLGQGTINSRGLTPMGNIDGFNIWLYQDWYKDDAGALQLMFPSGTVCMVGDMMGVQAYGAIQDSAAGYVAVPIYSKSWVENDPGRRVVMSQSAPLLVPFRPNASFCATVL